MTYVIAIPTHQRISILQTQTLLTLEKEGIERSRIYIFVAEDEYAEYSASFPDYQVVVGELGLIHQRTAIQNYFPEGQHILFVDDDILELDLLGKSLNYFINEAFDKCVNSGSHLWSVYPVWNKFFRIKRPYMTTHLSFCVGTF